MAYLVMPVTGPRHPRSPIPTDRTQGMILRPFVMRRCPSVRAMNDLPRALLFLVSLSARLPTRHGVRLAMYRRVIGLEVLGGGTADYLNHIVGRSRLEAPNNIRHSYRPPWLRLDISPIFFAGLVFSTTFRREAQPASAFGANLLGATVGGFAEYLGMVVGSHRDSVDMLIRYRRCLPVSERVPGRSRAGSTVPSTAM